MSRKCRALLISAPASGQGKTTVTAALARYFLRQGLVVRVFKTGPDFIDPMILTQASGAPVHQLDLWMVGEEACKQRLQAAAEVADIILIEGVMGLFDGTPSSADLAIYFGIPVLAVINSKGMAQTFGAVAHGLASYRSGLNIVGVLANLVSSENHAEMLAESVPEQLGYLASMRKDESISLPSRHLGLVQADEVDDLNQRLDQAADLLSIPSLEKFAPEVEFNFSVDACARPASLEGRRIGIACDKAFSFIYPANVELLERLGATIQFFSPLNDNSLPEVDSLWFPGGYPELFAEGLSANVSMKQSIRLHHEQGKPILAECGGMLYLSESLQTVDGRHCEMVGLLAGRGIMQNRLGGLGMQSFSFSDDEGLGGEVRGHTFHYSRLESELSAFSYAIKQRNGAQGEAVYKLGRLIASYLHFYFPSNPEVCASFFMSMEGLLQNNQNHNLRSMSCISNQAL